jgi:predicted chitinase
MIFNLGRIFGVGVNRTTFLEVVRPFFNGKLDQDQINGMFALLDAGKGLPLHHMANILAQVRRETGGIMAPIKETVLASHKDRNPSDAEVISRLDRAFSAGRLTWVKTPYWRDGWFGRGQIQITHKSNYDKFGVTKDQALVLRHSARIAVEGMSKGMFTGRKLSDYNFPTDLDNPARTNPRRIVNGVDGSDKDVARFHRQFATALQKARWPA